MPDRNIKITLQYDGSRYDGWQKQGNTDKTIQGKLEQILEKMSTLGTGENVIPQKFNLQVSGIDYIDVWLFATPNDGDMPIGYTQRSVSISARERAVTDENRIEVVMDG